MCERLTLNEGDALHHKKSIRNVVRLEISPEPVLLLGIGLYNGTDEEILDPNANITFDRTTTSINVWTQIQNKDKKSVDKLVSSKCIVMNTEQAKKIALRKFPNKVKHTMTVWLDEPLLLLDNLAYEIEHNVLPTDVQNHYSGWPITTLGAELWTCHGSTKSPTSVSNDIAFNFSEPLFKTGRSCLWEGQMPYLMFWRL